MLYEWIRPKTQIGIDTKLLKIKGEYLELSFILLIFVLLNKNTMKKYSNTTLYNAESPTVKVLPEGIKRIIKWNGIFYLGAETEDFIYFCNYQESCDNANVIMYRKADRSLASDNWFASNDFFELMNERSDEITYASPTIKKELKIIEKDLDII